MAAYTAREVRTSAVAHLPFPIHLLTSTKKSNYGAGSDATRLPSNWHWDPYYNSSDVKRVTRNVGVQREYEVPLKVKSRQYRH